MQSLAWAGICLFGGALLKTERPKFEADGQERVRGFLGRKQQAATRPAKGSGGAQ